MYSMQAHIVRIFFLFYTASTLRLDVTQKTKVVLTRGAPYTYACIWTKDNFFCPVPVTTFTCHTGIDYTGTSSLIQMREVLPWGWNPRD